MVGKIVTLEEFNTIHAHIMVGENIPRIEDNGYKVQTYLGNAVDYKHPTLDLYKIPQDAITQKYCTNFVELTPDWYEEETI